MDLSNEPSRLDQPPPVIGVRGLLQDHARPVTANRVNRGGHRSLKRPPTDFPKGFQGLWWIYAPTAKIQSKRMADLSKPKKSTVEAQTEPEEPPKRSLDWVIKRAKQLPGPGQYEPRTRTRLRYFGAFNESKPKTELEWHIYRGRSMPGPGSYTIDQGHKIPGGRFNEGHAKTSIEILQHYTRGLPGPADYDTAADPEQIPGGRFNTGRNRSELDWIVYYAKEKPGPGSYNPKLPPSSNGGRFGGMRPKTAVDWEIYRASQLPGPSDYNAPDMNAVRLRRGTPKFSESHAKSDLDWKILFASEMPGPGSYDPLLPGVFGNAFAEVSLAGQSGLSLRSAQGPRSAHGPNGPRSRSAAGGPRSSASSLASSSRHGHRQPSTSPPRRRKRPPPTHTHTHTHTTGHDHRGMGPREGDDVSSRASVEVSLGVRSSVTTSLCLDNPSPVPAGGGPSSFDPPATGKGKVEAQGDVRPTGAIQPQLGLGGAEEKAGGAAEEVKDDQVLAA